MDIYTSFNDFSKFEKSFTLETPLYGGGYGSVKFNFDHITVNTDKTTTMWYKFNSNCDKLNDIGNLLETLGGFFRALIIDGSGLYLPFKW